MNTNSKLPVSLRVLWWVGTLLIAGSVVAMGTALYFEGYRHGITECRTPAE